MEHLPIITTTAGLISNALSSIKSARELAKGVSDSELKEQISAAYETLIDLREHLLTLDEENRKLREQLADKAAYFGPVAPHGYFYAAEDANHVHPLCPSCYQSSPRQIAYMNEAHEWNRGVRRECKLCRSAIFEKPMDLSPQRGSIRPRFSR